MKRVLLSFVLVSSLAPLSAFAQEERNYLAPTRHWFGTVQTRFDSTDDTSIGASETTERALVWAAMQTWQGVACTDVTFVDQDVVDGVAPTNRTWGSDGVSATVFEDESCSPGVLAFNFPWYIENTEIVNGRTWRQIDETDTSFCADVDFGTPEEIDSPTCIGQFDMQGIALHEYGHGIGYAHTCEADESCGDPELRGAVMYWAVGACDGGQREPNAYDLETHSIAYGLGASSDLQVTNGSGGLPLEVSFAPLVIASASVLSVDWEFGDATEETTAGAATHTYTYEGRFSVGATIHATSPACGGEFTEKVRKVDVVIACNELAPEFTYDKNGKRVKFYSETLGAAAGCLQTLSWDFGDGGTANVKNPIHDYATAGDYTVTLTASGPPGTSAPFTREVKVSSGGGGGLFGCSLEGGEAPSTNSAAAAGVLGIAVVMSLATASRRRI